MPYLVIAIIFPLLFIGFLLMLDQKLQTSLTCSASASTAFVSEEVEFEASATVSRGFGLMFVRFPADARFELTEGSNVHVFFKGLRSKTCDYTYKLRALRRGVFEFPPISFSFYPSFGLLDKIEREVPCNIELRVLPKISLPRRGVLPVRSLQELPRQSRSRLGPHSTEFSSIRDYYVGDPFKFINWKASSRLTDQNKLLVNEYEREGLRTFIFVLDRSERMRKGTLEENPLEFGITLVLAFSRALLSAGINVGVWIVPPSRAKSQRGRYILPSSGTTHYNRIKELLLFAESEFFATGWDVDYENQRSISRALLHIAKEATPAVVFVTNLSRSNVSQFSRLSESALRAGASSVSIVDIIPDSIIAQYSSTTGAGISRRVSLKALLVPSKGKIYSNLPPRAKVVTWDPIADRPGYIMRRVLSLARDRSRPFRVA